MGSSKWSAFVRLLVLVSVSTYVAADAETVPAVQAVIEAKTEAAAGRSLRQDSESSYSFWRSLTQTAAEIFETAGLSPPVQCAPGCIAKLGHGDSRCRRCIAQANCIQDPSFPVNKPCRDGCIFGYSGFLYKLFLQTGGGGCELGCQVKKCLPAGSVTLVGSGGGQRSSNTNKVTLTNPRRREVRITWNKAHFENDSNRVEICRADRRNNCKSKRVSAGSTKDSSNLRVGTTYEYEVCTRGSPHRCETASIKLGQ